MSSGKLFNLIFWFDFRLEPILATSKNYSSKVVKSDLKNNYHSFSSMFTIKPDALDLQEKISGALPQTTTTKTTTATTTTTTATSSLVSHLS